MVLQMADRFELSPPRWAFSGQGSKMLFTVHPDGSIELGDGVSTDEAAQGFWDGLRRPGLDLYANGKAEAAAEIERLRASLSRAEEEKRDVLAKITPFASTRGPREADWMAISDLRRRLEADISSGGSAK